MVALTTFRRKDQHFNIYLLIMGLTLVLSGQFLPARSGKYLQFLPLRIEYLKFFVYRYPKKYVSKMGY